MEIDSDIPKADYSRSPSRENRDRRQEGLRSRLSKSSIEQKVDKFINNVDLAVLCSPDNDFMSVCLPVSRPANCFLQFKRVVAKYAAKHKIPGYNDQYILSKGQSKLWKMLSKEQKEIFKQLAYSAFKLHKDKYPDFEFHPHRDKSVLKIRFTNAGQSKRKKTPVQKPDQNHNTFIITPEQSNVEASDCEAISEEDVNLQQQLFFTQNMSVPLHDNSFHFMNQSFSIRDSISFHQMYASELEINNRTSHLYDHITTAPPTHESEGTTHPS
ncbi:13314_t:CDS:1 [Cetraspora pellucida]|uniref:13314_t:CDS:1 n=1 Tax=Cetraspora pellucida TaxID=1433469 RepID=A0A9N9DEM6_9GLOM|nr:13314_t:CDS:1 [Cetraspora pellucida]